MDPGFCSGPFMPGTSAMASAAKNPPQAKRYVSERPNGMAAPVLLAGFYYYLSRVSM